VADAGFDRSYKLDDQDRYFSPRVHFENDQPLAPIRPDSGFYATTAIADHALRSLKEHALNHKGKPFFHYLAFTSPHFPLHALQKDIDRYRKHYAEGWDQVRARRYKKLREMGMVNCALSPLEPGFTPRYFKKEVLQTLGPGEIEHAIPWPDLTEEQKRFQAAKMAIHAAMIDRMDREIGRVLDQVQSMNVLQNTVILFLSDNGTDATIMVRGDGHDRAAPSGSWQSFLCLGPGWSTVGNTPFRRHKIWVHEGGISTPLIVHWPRGISSRGELRHTPGHVIDFVPTLLDLAGARASPQWRGQKPPPLPGRSLVPAFARNVLVERDFLFFHHEGNRALRVGNWKLVSAREDQDTWDLYDLGKDRCESRNLAGEHPEKVKELEGIWLKQENQYRQLASRP
jgi:arylsulfatase